MSKLMGKVKYWNAEKHFGFILAEDFCEYFLHQNDCVGFTPALKMPVSFEVGKDKKQRIKAVLVEINKSVSVEGGSEHEST